MALFPKQNRCTDLVCAFHVPVIFSSGSLSLTGMGGVSDVLRNLWLETVWSNVSVYSKPQMAEELSRRISR